MLSNTLRVTLPERPDERIAVPVLERSIHVHVNPSTEPSASSATTGVADLDHVAGLRRLEHGVATEPDRDVVDGGCSPLLRAKKTRSPGSSSAKLLRRTPGATYWAADARGRTMPAWPYGSGSARMALLAASHTETGKEVAVPELIAS